MLSMTVDNKTWGLLISISDNCCTPVVQFVPSNSTNVTLDVTYSATSDMSAHPAADTKFQLSTNNGMVQLSITPAIPQPRDSSISSSLKAGLFGIYICVFALLFQYSKNRSLVIAVAAISAIAFVSASSSFTCQDIQVKASIPPQIGTICWTQSGSNSQNCVCAPGFKKESNTPEAHCVAENSHTFPDSQSHASTDLSTNQNVTETAPGNTTMTNSTMSAHPGTKES